MLAITRMKNFLIQQIIDPAIAGSAGPALTPLVLYCIAAKSIAI